MREMLGGFPVDISKSGSVIRIAFFPKSPNAKNPDSAVMVLKLDASDKSKMAKILGQ